MKRNLLLTTLFVFAFAGLFAQRLASPKAVQMAHPKAAIKSNIYYTGLEPVHDQVSVPFADNSSLDLVGNSVYDLQSNASVGRRVHNFGGGNVNAAFNFSGTVGTTWPDRGTGFNTRTGGAWGAPPTTRLEATRTGFTNYVVGSDGTEYVAAHLGTNKMNLAKRSGGGAWTESAVPGDASVLWGRLAVGGANGKSLHLIASSLPTGNGGALYQGMNGVVLYYRSLDGGATWDIKDMLLPGIDSTTFRGTDIESYAVDANGDNIAILTTNGWNDCLLYVSTDNGTSWEKRVVNDFPLENYVIDSGYDTLSLPPDPTRADLQDAYAIFTSDGTCDVLVDDQGITHVWYGTTYVSDSDLTDGNSSFYPGINIGIVYFNTLMADDEGIVAGYSPDINGNGVGDWPANSISNYGVGMASHPAASIDANGNLYVVYAIVHELYNDANSGFNFRQPYISASFDLGANWTEPRAVLDSILLGENDFTDVPYQEAIFNTAAKLADDKVHVVFQVDYSPLTNVQTAATDADATDNTIRYVGYPTDWLVGTKNVPAEALKFTASPNPANDRIMLEFTSDRMQNSSVELYDLLGNMVRSTAQVTVGAGTGVAYVTTSDLPTGMYVARLNLGNTFATKKVSVQH